MWGSWEGVQIDPETAGSMAAKGRGKGGILLMVIKFWPQFLVLGYGGLFAMAFENIVFYLKNFRRIFNF